MRQHCGTSPCHAAVLSQLVAAGPHAGVPLFSLVTAAGANPKVWASDLKVLHGLLYIKSKGLVRGWGVSKTKGLAKEWGVSQHGPGEFYSLDVLACCPMVVPSAPWVERHGATCCLIVATAGLGDRQPPRTRGGAARLGTATLAEARAWHTSPARPSCGLAAPCPVQAEEAAKAQNFPLGVTILRPGMLERGSLARTGEAFIAKLPFLSSVAVADVARVMVADAEGRLAGQEAGTRVLEMKEILKAASKA